MAIADGTVIGTKTVVDHGDASKRWNLVILGDGYQSSELTQYAAHVQQFVTSLQATPPFDVLWPAINIYRVDVASDHSGAKNPVACGGDGAAPATYFDATFCSDGQTQRTLSCNNAIARETAKAQVPQFHMIMVIVNSTVYGGTGGQVAVCSVAPDAALIAIHEMGHTAFGLADEYEYYAGCGKDDSDHDHQPAGVEPSAPNVTASSARDSLKWHHLVDANTPLPTTSNPNCSLCDPRTTSPVADGVVGAFEGAAYVHCGAFRPAFDCMMRNLGAPYCAVCREAIQHSLKPFLPRPIITSVSPSRGPASGGTRIKINGSGFYRATVIRFGTVEATPELGGTDTEVSVISPAGHGAIHLSVVTLAGPSPSASADLFTYE
jgi:hypothetical protein